EPPRRHLSKEARRPKPMSGSLAKANYSRDQLRGGSAGRRPPGRSQPDFTPCLTGLARAIAEVTRSTHSLSPSELDGHPARDESIRQQRKRHAVVVSIDLTSSAFDPSDGSKKSQQIRVTVFAIAANRFFGSREFDTLNQRSTRPSHRSTRGIYLILVSS